MALEEFGKAVLYHRIRLGLNPTTVLEKKVLKGRERIQKRGLDFDHRLKQKLGICALADAFLAVEIMELEPDFKSIRRRMDHYLRAILGYWKTFATEEERQKCFYVSCYDRKWHNPLDMRFDERSDIIPALEYVISCIKEISQEYSLKKLKRLTYDSLRNQTRIYEKMYERKLIDYSSYVYVKQHLQDLLPTKSS